MERILVGLDPSPASRDALSWARQLALCDPALEIVVVSVLDPRPAALRGCSAALHALRREREALLSRWLGSSPGTREESHLLEGVPGVVLAEAARRYRVDLVAVGAEGTRGRTGPRLGSVASHLAYHLDVPLLVVPCGRKCNDVREVVVGVNGSDESLSAVRALTEIRAAAGARFTAVYVRQPLCEGVHLPTPKGWYRSAAHDLACWTGPLGRHPHALRLDVRDDGHPALAILDAAEENDADLVVIGTRATNRITHTRLASTAFQMLHRATRPTLVVPPGPAQSRHRPTAPPAPVTALGGRDEADVVELTGLPEQTAPPPSDGSLPLAGVGVPARLR